MSTATTTQTSELLRFVTAGSVDDGKSTLIVEYGDLETLLEAVALVFLVMFLFLQNIRYTFIPTIVVPIALFGTFAVLQ